MLNNSNGISTIISNLSLVISFCFFVIGWLISFISSCVYSGAGYDKSWLWWVIVNGLISGILVFLVIDRNQINGYRFALMTYLGICINWSISLVHNLLHVSATSGNAVGVGQLLMCVAYFIWILYFGCEKETLVGKYTNFNGIVKTGNRQANPGNNSYNLQNVTTDNSVIHNEPSINNTPPPQQNSLRAKALYDYSANKEDPNEISFCQGEVMDIIDNNGRWWQARKADGTMGIVPSNFFEVI